MKHFRITRLALLGVILLLTGTAQSQTNPCSLDNCPNVQELVFNGDFAQGNTGFGTSLNLNCGFGIAGDYCIGLNELALNPNWNNPAFGGPFPSQTGDNYMIIDGPNDVGGVFGVQGGQIDRIIWSQSLNLTNNQVYEFGIDILPRVTGSFPPNFSIELIDAVGNINQIMQINPNLDNVDYVSGLANWNNFCTNFTFTQTTGQYTLVVRQSWGDFAGYDYGIDNISMRTSTASIVAQGQSYSDCEGQTISIGPNVNDPSLYTYNFGNGPTSQATIDVVVGNSQDIYSVDVIDCSGAVQTVQLVVTPLFRPDTYFDEISLCQGDDPVDFFITKAGNIISNSITVNGATQTANSAISSSYTPGVPPTFTFSFDPTTAGLGTHEVEICYNTNFSNCCSVVTFNVSPSPQLNIPATICSGEAPFLLHPFFYPNGATDITFSGNTSGINPVTHLFDPSQATNGVNTFTACYILDDGSTCCEEYSITILQSPNVTANDQFFCQDDSPINLAYKIFNGYWVSNPQWNVFSPNAFWWSSATLTPAQGLTIPQGNGLVSFDPGSATIGTTDITYTVTASNGCTSSATAVFTVEPTPNVEAGPDVLACTDNLCSGGPTLGQPGLVPLGTTYSWELCDYPGVNPSWFLSDPTSATPQIQVCNPQIINFLQATELCLDFCVTATSPAGCSSSDFVSVCFVNPSIVPLVATVNSGCGSCDNSITLSNLPSGVTSVNVNGTPIQLVGNQLLNMCAGTYLIEYQDATCRIYTTSVDVTGGSSFTVTATSTPTCAFDCTGTITLTPQNGTAPYTYTWASFTGASGSTATDMCLGFYTIDVTDANGCATSVSVNVQTQDPLTAGFSSVSYSSCDSSICSGQIILDNASGTGPYDVSWTSTNGDSGVETGMLPGSSIDNLCSGAYTLSITDNSSGCVAAIQYSATVLNFTSPNVTFTPFGTFDPCQNSVSANVTGLTAPITYQWFDNTTGSMTLIPGANSWGLSSLCPGEYCVVASGANGCSVSACYTFIGAQFIDFTVAPNPTNGTAQLTFDTRVDGAVELRTVSGILLERITLNDANAITIDLSNYENGVYNVHFISQNTSLSKRLMKVN